MTPLIKLLAEGQEVLVQTNRIRFARKEVLEFSNGEKRDVTRIIFSDDEYIHVDDPLWQIVNKEREAAREEKDG